MPELPDLTIYVEQLRDRLVDQALTRVSIHSPFLVRSYDPPIEAAVGRTVIAVDRIGKQIVFSFTGELFWVIHLMIAGRWQWRPPNTKTPPKVGLAAFSFETGTLVLTEASTKKRASLHCVQGRAALAHFNRGGIEVLECTRNEFEQALRSENHTLKRSLTDPRLFSAIGNAFSDEILHRAGLSPIKHTKTLTGEDIDRLFDATRQVMLVWIDRLRAETNDRFPEHVTAFRPEMAVHGKYRQPCPVCGTQVQRIVYAENECNYCPRCQTGGKLLADRALSKLLKSDWPKTIDELELRRG